MSIRGRILAETLARLEAERFSGPRRPEFSAPRPDPPPEVTAEQAADNAARLLAALDDDQTVIDFIERKGA